MKTVFKDRKGKKCLVLLLILMSLLLLPPAHSQNEYMTLDINIPVQFSEVAAGDFILVVVDIYCFRSTGKKDVTLTYTMKDKEGKIITTKTTTVAVETHLSDISKIDIPKDALPGTYTLEVEARYPKGESLKASEDFKVVRSISDIEGKDYNRYVLYLVILISILAFFAIYLIYRLIRLEEKRIKHGKS